VNVELSKWTSWSILRLADRELEYVIVAETVDDEVGAVELEDRASVYFWRPLR